MRTQLWACLVASLLLFVATILLNWPLPDALEWARTMLLSVCNGVLVALGAVGWHQVGLKVGVLTEKPREPSHYRNRSLKPSSTSAW